MRVVRLVATPMPPTRSQMSIVANGLMVDVILLFSEV